MYFCILLIHVGDIPDDISSEERRSVDASDILRTLQNYGYQRNVMKQWCVKEIGLFRRKTGEM